MWRKTSFFLGLASLMAVSVSFSCQNGEASSNKENQSTSTERDTLPPVETQEPNTDYQPAFEGQTRVNGMATETAYEGTSINSSLKEPWGIVALSDGRLLITQKEGTMVIVDTDGNTGETIKEGIPAVVHKSQGGLLGITLDPDFEKNRTLYWVFSKQEGNKNLTAVAKGKLSADEKSIEQAEVIYKAEPAYNGRLHFGGRVIVGKDGFLYVSTGERSDLETRPQAQQLNSALGKILRITKEGKPAPGNPFEDDQEARPEIWSYGHRNVQGLAWHPETDELWESEFGPLGGDEINVIQPGNNYGWATIGYGYEYSGEKVGEGITQKEGMEQPIYYWDPVVSPSGIAFYTGEDIPEWKNNLFVCGLSGQHIARLKIEGNKVIGEERLLEDENQRFRDITQGNDGHLYAVTDQGRLYKIGKK